MPLQNSLFEFHDAAANRESELGAPFRQLQFQLRLQSADRINELTDAWIQVASR
jgi:hypothetical protein